MLNKFPFRLNTALYLATLCSSVAFIQGCNSLPNKGLTAEEARESGIYAEQGFEFEAATASENAATPQTDTNPPVVTTVRVTEAMDKYDIIEAGNANSEVERHHDNIWDSLHGKFQLAEIHFGHYDDLIKFYETRQNHFEASSTRAEPYLYYIKSQVSERQMPMEIALLPLVESGFKARAKSHKKAVGLWQFMPKTGEHFGLEQNTWYDGRKDVVRSTQAALDYLQELYQKNNNDWLLALASYNAGYGNVLRAQKRYRRANPNTPKNHDFSFWQLKPYLPKETQRYVPKLLAVAYIINHNERYHLSLHPIANKPYFEKIDLNKQISIYAVADRLQLDNDHLRQLNPAYLKGATYPTDSTHFLVPTAKVEQFQEIIDKEFVTVNVKWLEYRVRSGDSLGRIAHKFDTSVKEIQKMNRLSSTRIRIGQSLLIPALIHENNHENPKASENAAAEPSTTRVTNTQTNTKTIKAQRLQTQNSSQQLALYKVKAGDNLSTIAHQHNIDIAKLEQLNDINRSKPLRINQTLKVPAMAASQQLQKKIYQVQSGDNLYGIAKQHGVTIKQIIAWNQLKDAASIFPKQSLIIWQGKGKSQHFEYQVRAGDNLWKIAHSNQLSTKTLADYNALSKKTVLKPGQILKIPHKI